jgi:hypothetical protein
MSLLTTITIINSPTSFLQRQPPAPLVRFFGRITGFDARRGVLTVTELPALFVEFDSTGQHSSGTSNNGSSSSDSKSKTSNNNPKTDTSLGTSGSRSARALPTVSVQLPDTILDLAHTTVRQRLVVCVLGHFDQFTRVITASEVVPIDNQCLFDPGYKNNFYSDTVLQKVQVVQYIAQC